MSEKLKNLAPSAETIAKLQAQHSKIIASSSAAATGATTASVAGTQSDTPEIGDIMPDGSIYAGVSPDTGKGMFAMPADTGSKMDFDQADEHTAAFNKDNPLGHDDWRIPSKDELRVLFDNQKKGALSGTFNLTSGAADMAGMYWSSTQGSSAINAWSIRFNHGVPELYFRGSPMSVRYVR